MAVLFWLFTIVSAAGLIAPIAHAEETGFAGSAACAECHAAESAAWQRSYHHWALKAPDPQSMLGDFNDASFSHKGVKSRFFTRNGKYFVETEGESGSTRQS